MPRRRASAISVVRPLQLGRRAGEHHGAALVEAAVDALGRDHAPDLADGLLHGQALGACRRPGPAALSSVASDTLNSAEHQPPLRPDAPNPATSRSSTAMRSPGSLRLR